MVKYLEIFIFKYKYYNTIYQINNNNLKKPDFRLNYIKFQKNFYQIYLHISIINTNFKLNKMSYCFYNKYLLLNISINYFFEIGHLYHKTYGINNINLHTSLKIKMKISIETITIRRPL